MRTWILAPLGGMRCGFCWGLVKQGQPIQRIELGGQIASRYRCQEHAKGEVDWAQIQADRKRAEQLVADRVADSSTGFKRFDRKAFDRKLRAAGGDHE